jgi:hypothetical protein
LLKFTVPSARLGETKIPATVVVGPMRSPFTNVIVRYEAVDGGHGPGIQMTSGAIERFSGAKVCVPEQPPKLCEIEIDVIVSSPEMVNAIGTFWAVTPLHWPA